MQYKLGFIGCGNMGGALVAAATKAIPPQEIAVCDHHQEKLAALEQQFGVVPSDEVTIAKNATFVVIGVKPQTMQNALSPIAEILCKRADVVIVTMAAGVSIAATRAFIGGDIPVIRTMPNTPAKVGEGMILYSLSGVSEARHAEFLTYFSKAGKLDCLDESLIDGGSALSGCGPAFAYAFAEALIQGGIACGVPQDKAEFYAAQTLKGAAEMLLTFGDPVALRKAVCSPNGTTLEGVKALEEGNFFQTAASAVTAAYKRTLELKR